MKVVNVKQGEHLVPNLWESSEINVSYPSFFLPNEILHVTPWRHAEHKGWVGSWLLRLPLFLLASGYDRLSAQGSLLDPLALSPSRFPYAPRMMSCCSHVLPLHRPHQSTLSVPRLMARPCGSHASAAAGSG